MGWQCDAPSKYDYLSFIMFFFFCNFPYNEMPFFVGRKKNVFFFFFVFWQIRWNAKTKIFNFPYKMQLKENSNRFCSNSVKIQWIYYLIGSHPLPGVQWIDSNYRFTLSTCTTNVGLASSAHHNNPEDNQHTSNTAPTSNTAVSSNHTQIQYGSAYTSGQMITSNETIKTIVNQEKKIEKKRDLAYPDEFLVFFFSWHFISIVRQMWFSDNEPVGNTFSLSLWQNDSISPFYLFVLLFW